MLTALSVGGGRGVSLLSSLIFAPLAFHYLGPGQFGIWVTLTSLIGLLGFSDLGFGNGLVSAAAKAYGEEDVDALRRSIATTFFLLLTIALFLGLVFLVLYPIVAWGALLNSHTRSVAMQVAPAVAVMVVAFLVGLPLVVAEKTQLGVQRGYIAGAWLVVGNVIGLMVSIGGVILGAPLPVFVGATLGGPALAAAANCVLWFGGRWRAYRPHLHDVSRETAGAIFRMGSLFLALNLTAAVGFVSDPIVVNQVLGPRSAAQFWLPMRLFSFVPVGCSLLLTGLWPAYAEALARRDVDWAVRTLKRSLKIGLACSVPVALTLALAGSPLIHWWIGPAAHPNRLLLLALAAWAVFWIVGNVIATFLTGARVIRLQAICGLVMAAFNLPLSIVLARAVGPSGVVWGSVATYAVFVAVPYAIAVPRIVARIAAG